MLPIRGLKSAMNNPWVVMINPTYDGATPKPSLNRLRTGAMRLPAMMVKVAEARITPRESFFEPVITKNLSPYIEFENPTFSAA